MIISKQQAKDLGLKATINLKTLRMKQDMTIWEKLSLFFK